MAIRTKPINETDRRGISEARLSLRLTVEQAEAVTGTKKGTILGWEAGRGSSTGDSRERIYQYLTALGEYAVSQGISPERCLPHVACPGLFAPPLGSNGGEHGGNGKMADAAESRPETAALPEKPKGVAA